VSKHQLVPPDEHELRDDVRKLLGKPPYNHPANFCWNDGYFHRSLQAKYGDARVAKMTTEVEKE
jgi:hypothetical protein